MVGDALMVPVPGNEKQAYASSAVESGLDGSVVLVELLTTSLMLVLALLPSATGCVADESSGLSVELPDGGFVAEPVTSHTR